MHCMSFSNEMTVTPVEQQLAHVPGGQMWKEEPPFIQHTLFYNYILHNPNTGIPNSSSSSYCCCSSQKPSSADISETEGGIIDALVSKQPDKILKKKCNATLQWIASNFTALQSSLWLAPLRSVDFAGFQCTWLNSTWWEKLFRW